MGIVAHCPHGHRVKVKDFLAGKKGICPTCRARFRIPLTSGAAPAAMPIAALESLDATLATTLPSSLRLDGEYAPPTAIAEAVTALWSIAVPGGRPSAAMSGTDLLDWLTSGGATGAELVWRSDWTEWRPVAEVFPDHAPGGSRPPGAAW
jgi:hypothetical protein